MMDIIHHHPIIFWTTVTIFGIVVGYLALMIYALNQLGGAVISMAKGFWGR